MSRGLCLVAAVLWAFGLGEARATTPGQPVAASIDPAAAMAQEAIDLNRAGNQWLVWSSVTGAAVGGLGGFIYATQTKADATDITGEIRLFHIVIGALGGAAVGAIVGGVQRWRLRGQAEVRSRQASQAFDGSWRRRLDLAVVPSKGGASGQLSLAF